MLRANSLFHRNQIDQWLATRRIRMIYRPIKSFRTEMKNLNVARNLEHILVMPTTEVFYQLQINLS